MKDELYQKKNKKKQRGNHFEKEIDNNWLNSKTDIT